MEPEFWNLREMGDLAEETTTLATTDRKEILRQIEQSVAGTFAAAAGNYHEQHDVAELFSPPRIVPAVRSRGLRAEHSFDKETDTT